MAGRNGHTNLSEDLTFRGSPEVSLGVELELQILERESNELSLGATRILQACKEERLKNVTGEFLLSMLEVKTGVCRNVADVQRSLMPTLRSVHKIASSLGYDLAIGGTHPNSRPMMSAIYPDPRYQRILHRQGWTAYQEAVFGMHVHVGVPGGDVAIGVMNLLVEYLPHLLALSADSPLWQGMDTSYASSRIRMFRPTANVGPPPYFRRWSDFEYYCQALHAAGGIRGTKDLYWDIRPRPALGTLEFRIFDVPPTLSAVLALTALLRCLVLRALKVLEDRPELAAGDQRHYWFAQENRWAASRFGLKTRCVRRPGSVRRSLKSDTARLLRRLEPVAAEAGESVFLDAVKPMLTSESGAERQRRIFRESGRWQAVAEDLKHRWLQELELEPLSSEQARGTPSPEVAPQLSLSRSGRNASHSPQRHLSKAVAT